MAENKSIENFFNSCDDLISCKFLVAEYKITKLLKDIANSSEICSLIAECLQSYNRDREFARTYIQDGHGQFVCVMPTEEFKIVALVFCTLADIDNKKIDFTDFIKRFFGREEKPFEAFVQTMIVPYKKFIAEAFGYLKQEGDVFQEKDEDEDFENEGSQEVTFDDEEAFSPIYKNIFEASQKIAVQILSELDEYKETRQIEDLKNIATSIIKTSSLEDEIVLKALTASIKVLGKGVKSIKFLIKELSEIVF